MTVGRRRAGWTALGLGATLALAAGCAPAGPAAWDAAAAPAGTAAAGQGATEAAGATGTPGTTAAQPGVPSAARLKAALLAPHDMGSAFAEQPTPTPNTAPDSGSSGGTTVTGCPQLQILLGVGTSPSAADQGVTYQAGEFGPTLGESLITAPPAALAAAYSDDRSALVSCKRLEFESDGVAFGLALSPISFGGPQSAAVRMDGTLEGVQVDAYLAIDDVGPAELVYFYLQVGEGSSQVASYYYRLADAKARQLGTGA
jgi:hypothetical protein